MRCSKWDYALALIFALLTLGICAFKITDNFRMFDDSAAYISQSIALAQGTIKEFISDNALMTSKQDLQYMTPASYPWGFPLLLAIIYKIFGFNIIAFKSVGVVCYALFVGIFYIFCAKHLPRIYAIFGSLLFAINPYLTHFAANEILSDIPFLLFGFIALIILAKLFKSVDCHDSLRESRKTRRSRSFFSNYGIFIAILGGIFMLFASLIRINGLVIVCALIAMHGILLAKRFAPKIFEARILKPFAKIDSPYPLQIHAIPYIIFTLGFITISTTLSSGTSRHTDYLTMISLQTMLNNIKQINFSWFIAPEISADLAITMLCVPFIALGIYASLRHKNAESSATISATTIFYVIFVLGFFALLLLWVAFDRRFVFLLLPFLVFWGAKGITLVNQSVFRLFVAMLLILIVVNCLWINAREISFAKTDTNPDNAYNAEAKELYKFIISHTPKDAMIISFKPRILYLATHRRSFVSPKITQLDEADFVLWNGKYVNDLRTMQDISSPAFVAKTKLIFENAEYKLFKVLK